MARASPAPPPSPHPLPRDQNGLVAIVENSKGRDTLNRFWKRNETPDCLSRSKPNIMINPEQVMFCEVTPFTTRSFTMGMSKRMKVFWHH